MNKKAIEKFLIDNVVVILFVFLCVGGFLASGQTLTFLTAELATRIARNALLVLALIIPVVAGLGLNFGIVLGAIAAQIAIFLTTHWGFVGIEGVLVTALLATPIAAILGYLVGLLFNQMKGTEMVGGLVLGYFAEGFYQFIFLFVFGGLIPIVNDKLMIATGVGVKNTIDLTDTIKYALDKVALLRVVEIAFYVSLVVLVASVVVKLVKKEKVDVKKTVALFVGVVAVYAITFVPSIEALLSQSGMKLLVLVEYGCVISVVYNVGKCVWDKFVEKKAPKWKQIVVNLVVTAVVYGATYIPAVYNATMMVTIPTVTYLCIVAICLFNNAILKTKLGQEMRAVGQNRAVANAAGINVDRVRIIAMILSTILASWGQLVNLQNVGTFSTYGAHTNTATFSIAALLVGGASVQKATNKQAILGIVLFHIMFIVAPLAGNQLFGNAAIGEYFRVFVSYGVIALALAMHAWKGKQKTLA